MLDHFLALDLKVFDPLCADAAEVPLRGAFVAFGNTAPEATRVVNSRLQRGAPSDPAFNPRTGAGLRLRGAFPWRLRACSEGGRSGGRSAGGAERRVLPAPHRTACGGGGGAEQQAHVQ